MKRFWLWMFLVAGSGASCSTFSYVRYPNLAPLDTEVVGRVFLAGDAGQVIFTKGGPGGTELRVLANLVVKQVAERLASARLGKLGKTEGSNECSILLDQAARETADQANLNSTLEALRIEAELPATKKIPSAIVWLGDNVYSRGVPQKPVDCGCRQNPSTRLLELTPLGDEYVLAVATLLTQARLSAQAGFSQTVFVPGNHDWDDTQRQGDDGRPRVLEQGRVLASFAQSAGLRDSLHLAPAQGQPGPSPVILKLANGKKVTLLAIDSEWTLHPNPDQGCGVIPGLCPNASVTPEHFYKELKAALEHAAADADHGGVIVAAHHPLATDGIHGGRAFLTSPQSWRNVLGCFSRQDLCHDSYKGFVTSTQALLKTPQYDVVAFAAGHEHNLQVLTDPNGGPPVLLSGGASKKTQVRPGGNSLLAMEGPGYMVVDFYKTGERRLRTISWNKAGNEKTVTSVALKNGPAS